MRVPVRPPRLHGWDLARLETLYARRCAQAGADHKAAVAVLNIVAADVNAGKFALVQGAMLVNKAVISCNKQITGIRSGQF